MPSGEPLSSIGIKVHVRIRPTAKPSPMFHIEDQTNTVLIDLLKQNGGGAPESFVDQIAFSVNSITQSTDQSEVYESCGRALVKDFLEGYNATFIAYGQVGSGKTYTMAGDMKVNAHRGFIARAIHQIFEEKEADPGSGIVLYISYLEIYQEALMCFSEGEKQRSYACHQINQVSSRSHTIFTLCMEKRVGRFKTEYDTVVAKLNLVDLAGFERLKKTNTSTGGRMRVEACSINKSLCLLEQALYAIKQGQEYVPFRQSKISIILKEALSGNCRTELILCLWPEEYFLDETIKASRFAQRLKVLRTFSIHNKKIDCCVLNERRHAQEIANLQQELALKDALQGRPGLSFDDLTGEVKGKLRETIQDFLQNDGELERIPIDNQKQVRELFSLFKESQVSLRAKVSTGKHCTMQLSSIGPLINYLEKVLSEHGLVEPIEEPQETESGVGELTNQGFHVGIAPPHARPHNPSASKPSPDEIHCSHLMLDYKEADPSNDVWETGSSFRNHKFQEYKHTTVMGKQQDSLIKSKQTELRTTKCHVKDLCEISNNLKQDIHNIKKILKEQHEEEFDSNAISRKADLYSRLKYLKVDFHKNYSQITFFKNVLQKLNQEIFVCKEGFLKSFYSWFETHCNHPNETSEEYLARMGQV
ncbi:kinesin-like protein KLP1 isoform X3 [Physcomitrium patens]|uniref:kinesin-like protein KLP1 isoform X3 n=1 Tax=Physcomitrium patens TaxID=3218 RepID=UPI003CCD0029